MAFPVNTSPAFPQHSGTYIPTLYASMLLVEFYKASVFSEISNTEHEGELQKFGDTLKIRTLPDVTINDYAKGQTLTYETPEGGEVDLLINKGKYWAMAINALDVKQMDIDHAQKWAVHASEKLKVSIDGDVLQNIYTEAPAANKGAAAGAISGSINLGSTGAPLSLTKTNIVDAIVDAGVVLDEQNVPEQDRWVTLPAWACALIKTSELKDASLTGDGVSTLRNGMVGMIDRFKIYCTNNLSNVTDGSDTVSNSMFGWKGSTAFASQMTNTETIDNPNDFGQLLRSLQAYGYKVTKPEGLGHLYITKG